MTIGPWRWSGRVTPGAGKEAARLIATDRPAGVTVVSGLARGIDAVVHRVNLEAWRRFPPLVLGSGVDIGYPWENLKLAQDIAEHGAVISEYPVGTQPEASNFPP